MTQRKLWVTLFVVSIIVTLIGLGFSVYNYYVFDKPFMTTSTNRKEKLPPKFSERLKSISMIFS